MLDLERIRTSTDEVRSALLKRMDSVDLESILELDRQHRESIQLVEELKAKRNKTSGEIPKLKKAGEDVTSLLEEMKTLSGEIKQQDERRGELHASLIQKLEVLPNIPDEDVPAGGKEANEVLRTWAEKPEFAFDTKDHVELATSLGVIDYERGTKLAGAGFWIYSGVGAKLEWALLNYFLETHLQNGFEMVIPPLLLNYECGYVAGQFPKFGDDVFQIEGSESEDQRSKFLVPTSEAALASLHRDEILDPASLPRRYVAYTPCFRKEAGSYRASERGMIRGHQFNKVEMFVYCTPEQSDQMLEELIGHAEKLVQGLGLHYQLSKLAAKDASAAMAKTYDIEVWIPSMDEYKEVSSASNSRDYQARRGQMRFKPADSKKTVPVHTLNASGLATSRIVPAMLEQFQQEDGTVRVPEPLQKWVGSEFLSPR